MNAFQICHNTSDLIPFYLPQQLYLKPIARINISLQLPNVKKLGKSISHWEIMDKIRELIRPDEFTVLKVTKTTVEFIRFEAEIETRDKLERILSKVNNKMIKLKDFSELMRLKAAEWKSDFPNRHIWDDFFQNARDMDEMKPGQRPDTIHISNVPSKWFIPYHLSDEDEITPSEKIFYRAFEKFGSIRSVDIPICDPYRNKMKDHISGLKTSTFTNKEFFEGYVQFKDYIGFTRAMDSLRNMKLVHKEDDTVLEVNIKVDFDKSKHLSEASMKRRSIVRERLVKKAAEQYEKDKLELEEKKRKEYVEKQKELDIKEQKKMRRKIREEKRKAKMLEKLEINGAEINDKIAKEEKKLLRVQRKLEAIRLIEELFRRIQDKNPHNIQRYDNPQSQNELRNFKNTSELEVLQQRENLHNALKGRVMLKSVLSGSITKRDRRHSSSSSNSDLSLDTPIHPTGQPPSSIVYNKYPELMYEHNWLGVPYFMPTPIPDPYHHLRGFLPGRGFPRLPSIIPGPSRGGGYGRRRGGYRYRGGARGGGGNFNHQYPTDREYNNDHDDRSRSRDSYSPPRRRRSRSRSRRSYSRSYSRSRSRSRTRRRRSRSHSYRSRSRQSYSRSRSREKRSKSRSKSRSSRRKKFESNNPTRDKSKDKKYKSRSREKSVDSCAFMTPAQLHEKRARSKSWSMPKDSEKDRSWSKSPSRKKE